MQTLYVITNERYSPEPDVMTLSELRAMLDDLGWNVDLFEKSTGIYDVRGFKVATPAKEYFKAQKARK